MTGAEADVLVVGGGMGGVAAALAALRRGRTVLLTEETDWLGGQLTSQGVPPDEHPWIEQFGATRSYRRLREAIRDHYRTWYPLTRESLEAPDLNLGRGTVSRLCCEPRVAAAVLAAMVSPYLAAGRLTIRYLHRPVAADVDGDRVAGVTFAGPDGEPFHVRAAYVLDATELAGPAAQPRRARPAHAGAGAAHVRAARPLGPGRRRPEPRPGRQGPVGVPAHRVPRGVRARLRGQRRRHRQLAADRLPARPADRRHRRRARPASPGLQGPGAQHALLAADRGAPPRRRHRLARAAAAAASCPFQIPLGALLPVRVRNVLAAGKNLGTTHITNGCYRLHPVEWNIGEAAGALAAHCLRNRLEPAQVHEDPADLERFQAELSADGFELAWPQVRGY
ncbi:FAD-dependent oxidoreductase [Nonomuraea sp. NEAU-A123]|uniref:FAD-dependent oxidoreductase n=1 Tax=Nonomuraea sp. NEAU-A123 TaxID=2839649 RepID=UPI0027E1715B|nr:FAD-dependent oxidoreductase [Nonomuraea sp. NEAU-A123]